MMGSYCMYLCVRVNVSSALRIFKDRRGDAYPSTGGSGGGKRADGMGGTAAAAESL